MLEYINGKPIIMTCYKKNTRDLLQDCGRFISLVEHHNEYYSDRSKWGLEEDENGIYIVEEINERAETD